MKKLKIFVTSCEVGPGAWQDQENKLKKFYEMSDKKYCLTDSPESADIILMGNIREEDWGKKVLHHELINKYPAKCFSLTEAQRPLFLNHGIYTNATNSLLTLGRVRTGSYTIYADRFLNPYVNNHVYSGKDNIDKNYLLTFIGRNSHTIRNIIFNLDFTRQDILIEDSSNTFKLWAQQDDEEKRKRQKYYYDILLRSKFSLCPRGGGANSIRLFESMQLGVAPVIVSDAWKFPHGPKWDDFSIIIREKDLSNLEQIVQSYESSYEEMGSLARKAHKMYFAEDVYFDYVVDNCLDIMRSQLIPETVYWRLNPILIYMLKTREKLLNIRGKLRLKTRIKSLLSSGAK